MRINVTCSQCHKGTVLTMHAMDRKNIMIHVIKGCNICGYTPKSATRQHTFEKPKSTLFDNRPRRKIKIHGNTPQRRVHVLRDIEDDQDTIDDVKHVDSNIQAVSEKQDNR